MFSWRSTNELPNMDASLQFAAWNTHDDLLLFMANDYSAFLEDIRNLLAGEGLSSPLSAPFIVESGMRTVELGVVTSIYELEFDPAPSADVKLGLHIDIQMCRSLFNRATERLNEGDHFLKMDACWIEEPQQNLQSPSPSSRTDPTTQMDQATQIPCTKLFLMTKWESAAGERRLLDSADPPRDSTETAGGYFADKILQKASRYTKHQVIFENVFGSNVVWLDKDEKWSVYVARLMADEARRRADASSALGRSVSGLPAQS